MPTNVPPIVWTEAGPIAPSGPEILAGVQADIDAAFGGNLNFALNTPQGQISQSWAATIANFYALMIYYANQTNPAYASGRMQDAIGNIYFIRRDPSEPTALQIACNGLPGTVIPLDAAIIDAAGQIYECVGAGTIDISGTITLPFACTIPGPVAVPDTVTIYQAINGWDSAVVVSGAEGVETEDRAAFELRRSESVAKNSRGPIAAIIGAVADVPGVIDYYGYNNSTSGPVVIGGVTIAAFSIYIAVAGGADQDIAQAILTKKGPGAPMVGNTTVVAYDDDPRYSAPVPYNIKFERPDDLQIIFTVQIVNGPGVPSDAVTLVRNAIIAAFNGDDGGQKARIGAPIYASRYIQPVAMLGPWAIVQLLQVGSAHDPAASFYGTISTTTLTVTAMNVGSGAIAVGQSIIDNRGLIVDGTTILSQLGGTPGGAGTYDISISQTNGATTFTGVGSGTNLTASAVTGTIYVGDTVTGTGIGTGVTILSQTSGTPGGAGIYVTSASTTVNGATTARATISAVTGDQNIVTPNIDEIPQITASNIQVSLI